MPHHASMCYAMLAAASLVTSPVFAQDSVERAQAEYEEVIRLTPDLERGRQVYLTCAVCHRPEGWGTPDGTYPQIAGQWPTVIIKQLADIRAGYRDNPLMYPFSVPRILGGPQSIADVAAYVSQLPMTADNGKGPGTDLALGRGLYERHCVNCHGDHGGGNRDEHIPKIAGQHFPYLMRQFDAIRSARRHNADPKMIEQIEGFSTRQQVAVLDYVSRLPLAPGQVAPAGWMNPDFPSYVRDPMGLPSVPPIPQALLQGAPPGPESGPSIETQ